MNWIKVMGGDGRTYLLNVDNVAAMTSTVMGDKTIVWLSNVDGSHILDVPLESIEEAMVELAKQRRKHTEEEYKESMGGNQS